MLVVVLSAGKCSPDVFNTGKMFRSMLFGTGRM